MRLLSTIILFFFLCSFFACNDSMDCLEPDGEMVKETFKTEAFENVVLNVSGEIMYMHSDDYILVFEGPANYFDALTVEVKNGTMNIKSNRCFDRTTGFAFQVGAPDLSGFEFNGAGRFVGTATMGSYGSFKLAINGAANFMGVFETEELDVSVNGSGNIAVAGNSKKSKISINGTGSYDAYMLIADHTNVNIAGAGKAHVHANETLKVQIAGVGEVGYRGHPEIERSILGGGSIVDAN